jgi:hypothetical protein
VGDEWATVVALSLFRPFAVIEEEEEEAPQMAFA